jgi:hypothetical protein
MNQMTQARTLEGEGFGVGHTVESYTKGIWMLPRAIKGRTAAGEPVDVIVMDSEGLGAVEQVMVARPGVCVASPVSTFWVGGPNPGIGRVRARPRRGPAQPQGALPLSAKFMMLTHEQHSPGRHACTTQTWGRLLSALVQCCLSPPPPPPPPIRHRTSTTTLKCSRCLHSSAPF